MHQHKQSGYTLLEMTVIIGIVATLLGSYLAFYKPTQDARATAETKVKIEKILDSVASHALRFGYLPCPANVRNATITGVEDRAGNDCHPNTQDGNVHRGIIPYSTLGLPQDDAKDGFGRYMTYFIWRDAGRITATAVDHLSSLFCGNNNGDILLARNNDNQDNGSDPVRPFIVIISHGPDGIGGYNMSAGDTNQRSQPLGNVNSLGGDTSRGERRNAVGGASPNRVDINNYSAQTGNNHFDDVIGYMTSRGIILRLGVTYCGRTP